MTLESNGEIMARRKPKKNKDDDGLHYHGCWMHSGHHGCAVGEIERLTLLVNEYERKDATD